MNKAISSYRLINISKNCSAVNTVNSEMVLLPYCHSALFALTNGGENFGKNFK